MNLRALRLPVFAGLLIGSCAIYDASLLEPDSSAGSGGEAGATNGASGSGGEGPDSGSGGGEPDGGPGGNAGANAIGPCTVGGAPGDDVELFEDFEDGNTQISRIDPVRSGYWYTSSDCDPPPNADSGTACTGEQMMVPDPPGAPVEAVAVENAAISCGAYTGHITGSGFTGWGVTVGSGFKDQGIYDASAYCGMRFRARVGSGANVNAAFVIGDQVDVDGGGTMGGNFQKGLTLTTSWQTYVVKFSEMTPAAGTARPMINSEAVSVMNFLIGALQPFDLWIDDFYLIKKPESGDCPE